MTCIVGMVDKLNKKVYIGGDSAGVDDNEIVVRKDVKVFKNKDFIIGGTSSFRMIQLLRFSFKPPKINKKDIYKYMCTDFIDKVRECFYDGGYLQSYKNGDELGGVFLVGYKDRLFYIDEDFQVGESKVGYDTIGCGRDYAKGAITALIKYGNLTTKEIVKTSLKISSEHSTSVCGPYNIIST